LVSGYSWPGRTRAGKCIQAGFVRGDGGACVVYGKLFQSVVWKQDKLQEAIESIKWLENLRVDADRNHIFKQLSGSNNKTTIKELRYFNGEVPHRFLNPWFRATDTQLAYAASQRLKSNVYTRCSSIILKLTLLGWTI
jgi:hypothetical protein